MISLGKESVGHECSSDFERMVTLFLFLASYKNEQMQLENSPLKSSFAGSSSTSRRSKGDTDVSSPGNLFIVMASELCKVLTHFHFLH